MRANDAGDEKSRFLKSLNTNSVASVSAWPDAFAMRGSV